MGYWDKYEERRFRDPIWGKLIWGCEYSNGCVAAPAFSLPGLKLGKNYRYSRCNFHAHVPLVANRTTFTLDEVNSSSYPFDPGYVGMKSRAQLQVWPDDEVWKEMDPVPYRHIEAAREWNDDFLPSTRRPLGPADGRLLPGGFFDDYPALSAENIKLRDDLIEFTSWENCVDTCTAPGSGAMQLRAGKYTFMGSSDPYFSSRRQAAKSTSERWQLCPDPAAYTAWLSELETKLQTEANSVCFEFYTGCGGKQCREADDQCKESMKSGVCNAVESAIGAPETCTGATHSLRKFGCAACDINRVSAQVKIRNIVSALVEDTDVKPLLEDHFGSFSTSRKFGVTFRKFGEVNQQFVKEVLVNRMMDVWKDECGKLTLKDVAAAAKDKITSVLAAVKTVTQPLSADVKAELDRLATLTGDALDSAIDALLTP